MCAVVQGATGSKVTFLSRYLLQCFNDCRPSSHNLALGVWWPGDPLTLLTDLVESMRLRERQAIDGETLEIIEDNLKLPITSNVVDYW